MPLTRSKLRDLLNVDQPLHNLYVLEYKNPDTDIAAIFDIEDTTMAELKDITSYGVSAMEDVGEGGATPYDEPGLGYKTIYAPRVFKKGIQVTYQMYRQCRYRKMKENMVWLARRSSIDPVKHAFGVFRNATTVYPSGYAYYQNTQALMDGAHPYENGDSGTQSNYLTDVLSTDSLNDAAVKLMEQMSGEGDIIAFDGKFKLLVPPKLKKTAVEITESTLDPDTANNAVNVFKGIYDVVVCPYISAAAGGSDTAWYLIAPGAKLKFIWGLRIEKDKEIVFDTGMLKYKVEGWWQAGHSDWRGVVGSDGTT